MVHNRIVVAKQKGLKSKFIQQEYTNMARDEEQNERQEKEELKKTILLLQDELEQARSPPYMTGTVLDFGKENARISVDRQGVFEIPGKSLKEKFKQGSRVILNPMTKSVVGLSEFDFSNGKVVTVEEVDEKTLKIQDKGESYIVLNNLEGVKVGDDVMLDQSGSIAVKYWGNKKTPYALEKKQMALCLKNLRTKNKDMSLAELWAA